MAKGTRPSWGQGRPLGKDRGPLHRSRPRCPLCRVVHQRTSTPNFARSLCRSGSELRAMASRLRAILSLSASKSASVARRIDFARPPTQSLAGFAAARQHLQVRFDKLSNRRSACFLPSHGAMAATSSIPITSGEAGCRSQATPRARSRPPCRFDKDDPRGGS